MLPYPTCNISFSFLICLLLVSLETKEWKPLTAPHAIVTNNVGNKYDPVSVVNPVKAGVSIVGLLTKTPTTAATIIPTNKNVVK